MVKNSDRHGGDALSLFHSVWRFSLKICNLGMSGTGRARKHLKLGHSQLWQAGTVWTGNCVWPLCKAWASGQGGHYSAQIHKEGQRTPSPNGRSTKVLVVILKTITMTKWMTNSSIQERSIILWRCVTEDSCWGTEWKQQVYFSPFIHPTCTEHQQTTRPSAGHRKEESPWERSAGQPLLCMAYETAL